MQQKEKKKSPLLISEKKSNIYKNLNKNKYMPPLIFLQISTNTLEKIHI